MPDISYIDISGYVVTAVSDYSLWTSPNITKLANMFKDCSSFVGIGLPLWKTSNVTDMSGMFSGCTHFNQDLSGWITSNVTTMARMFKDDISFNGNIGKWNTSKVTDMSGMFSGCTTFNRDISGWDISGLMNAANMLDTTNLSVITYTNLLIGWGSHSIIQSGVTLGADTMSYYVDKYNVNKLQNTYGWTIGGTPTHVVPFYLSSSTNWSNAYLDGSGNAIYPSISGDSIVATSDFSLWNPSGVTNMSGMFKNCSSFTGIGLNTSYWNNDISSVTDMSGMFAGCTNFNQDISGWNTSKVVNMNSMFQNDINFNGNIGNWNTSKVTDMSGMFSGCTAFNQDLSGWDISGLTDATNMLNGCGMSSQNYSNLLIGWALNAPYIRPNVPFGSSNLQYSTSALSSRNILTSAPYNWTITDAGIGCPPSIAALTSWASMFFGGVGSTTIPAYVDVSGYLIIATTSFSNWDPSMVTNFQSIFLGCASFVGIGVPLWKTTSAVNTSLMFNGCTNFNQDLSGWNTSNVTNMSNMFGSCSLFNQDLSGWNTSNVTNMSDMFGSCSLFNQDLSWNTSNVTNMNNMFKSATSFNGNINNWNTSKVTDMGGMFQNDINFNKNIGNWNTSKVTDMSSMFNGCTTFNQDLSGWDISGLTNATNMLNGCGMSSQNYSNLLIGWALNAPYIRPNVPFGSSNLQYFPLAQASRDILTSAPYNWTITDAGIACPPSIAALTSWANMFVGGVGSTTIPAYVDVSGYVITALTSFNSWDPSMVTNFNSMFKNSTIFTGAGLSSWNTSNVTDMSGMFSGCTNFNQTLSSWNTSKVTTMSSMFLNATAFNQDISAWDISGLTSATNMLDGTAMSVINLTSLLVGWGSRPIIQPSHVLGASGRSYYVNKYNVNKLLSAPNNWTTTATTTNVVPFYLSGLTNWSFAYLGGTGSALYPAITGDTINASSDFNLWNTSGVTNMSNMFKNCTSFTGIGLDAAIWKNNIVSASNMSSMFAGCTSFTGSTISAWLTTGSTTMSSMFVGCTSFNTSLNSWSTSIVNDMINMFSGCTNFNQTLSSWNTTNVVKMASMFKNCASFTGAGLSSWIIASLNNAVNMLDSTNLSATTLSRILINWGAQATIISSVSLGCAGRSYYPRPETDSLKINKYWTYVGITSLNNFSLNYASGVTWTSIAMSPDGTNLAALQPDTNISTPGNYVIYSTNSGSNWSVTGTAIAYGGGSSITFGDKFYYCGGNGSPGYTGYIYSSPTGATLTQLAGQPYGSAQKYMGITSSSTGVKLAVAHIADSTFNFSGRINYSTNSGANWTEGNSNLGYWVAMAGNNTNTNICAIARQTNGGNYTGSIYISSNSGANWAIVSSTIQYWSAITFSASSTIVYACIGLLATAGDTNTGNTGQIWKSADSGSTWAVLSASPVLCWTSIACSSTGSTVVASNTSNGVYISTNSGSTWQIILTITGVSAVSCSSDGSLISVCVNSSGIWTYIQIP